MPFGLSNAPATFQRLIDRVIGTELRPHAFCYLDDIIVVTETFEDHLKYSVTEKECLAVMWGIRKFWEYLEGFSFKVITVHSSLKWLHNLRNPTGRLARWSLELLEYDFEIIHRKGALHHVPDALSRITVDEEIPISSACDASDSWYKRRVAAVLERPWIFPD